MNEDVKNMLVRSLSGIVLVTAFVNGLVWSPWGFLLVLALLAVGGMYEFYALAAARGVRPQRILGVVAGLLLLVLHFVLTRGIVGVGFGPAMVATASLLVLIVPVLLICELYRKNSDPLACVATTLLGICYVVLPLICLFSIAADGPAGTWRPRVALGYIVIVWANDVLAYLIGKLSGGPHKLSTRLSPKKSWEGFVGGVLGAVAAGLCFGRWLGGSLWGWAGLALVAAVAGVLGDLAESMFKRAADTKDSGTLIPGHGGVLDRFDAVLLSAPFVAVYLMLCDFVWGVDLL